MHYVLVFLLLSGIFLQPAAAQVVPARKDIIATHIKLPGAECALFPAPAELPIYLYEPGGRPLERFTPIPQQLALVEQAFLPLKMQQLASIDSADSLNADTESRAFIYTNLKKYYRQYYGFYNCQHQPCLYINCFLDPDVAIGTSYDIEPYWLRGPVSMLLGGASYWSITFNLTTQELYNFRYNRSKP